MNCCRRCSGEVGRAGLLALLVGATTTNAAPADPGSSGAAASPGQQAHAVSPEGAAGSTGSAPSETPEPAPGLDGNALRTEPTAPAQPETASPRAKPESAERVAKAPPEASGTTAQLDAGSGSSPGSTGERAPQWPPAVRQDSEEVALQGPAEPRPVRARHFRLAWLAGLGRGTYDMERLDQTTTSWQSTFGTLDAEVRLKYSACDWLAAGVRAALSRYGNLWGQDEHLPFPPGAIDFGGVAVFVPVTLPGGHPYAGMMAGLTWLGGGTHREFATETTTSAAFGYHVGLLGGLRLLVSERVALLSELRLARRETRQKRTTETASGAPVPVPLRATQTEVFETVLTSWALGVDWAF
jgi:hypothetical protein